MAIYMGPLARTIRQLERSLEEAYEMDRATTIKLIASMLKSAEQYNPEADEDREMGLALCEGIYDYIYGCKWADVRDRAVKAASKIQGDFGRQFSNYAKAAAKDAAKRFPS